MSSPITTPYFCFFGLVWIYLRHYINLRILYSLVTSYRTVGPFILDWEAEQYKCWISQYITFGLIGGLPYLGTSAATIYMAQQAGTALTGKAYRVSTLGSDET